MNASIRYSKFFDPFYTQQFQNQFCAWVRAPSSQKLLKHIVKYASQAKPKRRPYIRGPQPQ